ncbi:MAG TPA: hypothetical protein VF139_13815 [Candidatus Polarisedimenticolaceae bacterium]
MAVDYCSPQSFCQFGTGDSTTQWSGGSLAWRGSGSAVLGGGGPATNLGLNISTGEAYGYVTSDAFILRDFEDIGFTTRIERGTGAGSISHGSTLLARRRRARAVV